MQTSDERQILPANGSSALTLSGQNGPKKISGQTFPSYEPNPKITNGRTGPRGVPASAPCPSLYTALNEIWFSCGAQKNGSRSSRLPLDRFTSRTRIIRLRLIQQVLLRLQLLQQVLLPLELLRLQLLLQALLPLVLLQLQVLLRLVFLPQEFPPRRWC